MTDPAVGPAVKVTDAPVVALSVEPRFLLLNDHEYVVPEGHVATLQAGVAVNDSVPLTATDGEVGDRETEEMVAVLVIVIIAEAVFVVVLWVAVTVSSTTPWVLPAVKVVVCAVGELMVPRDVAFNVQE